MPWSIIMNSTFYHPTDDVPNRNAIFTASASSIIAVFAVVVSILARFAFVSLRVEDATDSATTETTRIDESRNDDVATSSFESSLLKFF
jgi:hypothetical protein